jgi:hypothetical protein
MAAPTPASSATTRSSQAKVTLVVTPNPVVATESRDSGSWRRASWDVVLTETTGVGVTVNFLNVTLRDAATGVLVEPQGVLSLSPADLVAAAGSNRLPPSGTLTVPQEMTFTGDTGSERLEIVAQLFDDNGHVFGASVTGSVD